jgi:hypothetical protein
MACISFHLGFTQAVKRTKRNTHRQKNQRRASKGAISQPKDGDFCCAIITDYLSTIIRLHHRLLQETKQTKKDPDPAKTYMKENRGWGDQMVVHVERARQEDKKQIHFTNSGGRGKKNGAYGLRLRSKRKKGG